MRLIFAGTPEFSAHHLKALIDDGGHQIVGVYTQPDRRAGRGKKLISSPVKLLSEQYHLPLFQPPSLKTADAQQELKSLKADVMVVVAYGLLLPQAVLDAPRYGCINVHASLLPRWRGAAPIQRAVAAGDTKTGITIMQMDAGLDTGDMLLKTECPIGPNDTGGQLQDKLMQQGAPALLEGLRQIEQQSAKPETQDDSLACYAHKLTKEEAAIDWSLNAIDLHNMIRAFNPFPVAYFSEGSERIRVWEAEPAELTGGQRTPGAILRADTKGILVACGKGALVLKQLQLPGKKCLPVADILNGNHERFADGKVL